MYINSHKLDVSKMLHTTGAKIAAVVVDQCLCLSLHMTQETFNTMQLMGAFCSFKICSCLCAAIGCAVEPYELLSKISGISK